MGELSVEVDGDFGDLLEDLEPFIFEVDSAEANGLELAQDAGDFAGFAIQTPLAGEACADPAGQEADAHMVEDPLGLAMEHGADLAVALEFARGFFNFRNPDLSPSSCASRGNRMIPIFLTRPWPFKDQQRSVSDGNSLTAKRTNFHESCRARMVEAFLNH